MELVGLVIVVRTTGAVAKDISKSFSQGFGMLVFFKNSSLMEF